MRSTAHRSPFSSPATGPCRLIVGTSGFSYTEWAECGFYPEGTPSGKMLPFYAQRFGGVELNHTWYQMPKAEAIERQCSQAPNTFLFTVKLIRRLTHEIEAHAWRAHAARFRDELAPLLQTRQLAAILIALPFEFDRTKDRRCYLGALLDALSGLPLAIEFSHASWATDRVFTELQQRHVTLVTTDTASRPNGFPALDVVTNPDRFYLRLHGRKIQRAYTRGHASPAADYNYSAGELAACVSGLIEPLAEKARQGFIFFCNYAGAHAPRNAQQLLQLLLRARQATVLPQGATGLRSLEAEASVPAEDRQREGSA